MPSTARLSQSVALAASAIGLLCACGFGLHANAPPPPPPPLPKISLSTADLEFDPQVIGTRSPARQITVTNDDVSSFSLADIKTFASTNSFEVDAKACLTELAPGKSCVITVIFQPERAKCSEILYLHIPNRGFLTVNLRGTGITASMAPKPPSP